MKNDTKTSISINNDPESCASITWTNDSHIYNIRDDIKITKIPSKSYC